MARVDIFFEKYYTDLHNVDEDLTTVPVHGGDWVWGEVAGMMDRSINDSPVTTSDVVATGCRHPKLFIYYTDDYDVDEDETTAVNLGGNWRFGDVAGIACRYVSAPIHYTENNVASLEKINRTYSPCGDACSIAEI